MLKMPKNVRVSFAAIRAASRRTAPWYTANAESRKFSYVACAHTNTACDEIAIYFVLEKISKK